MNINIEHDLQFPMATLTFNAGEGGYIASGSMIYRSAGVSVNAKLNSKGSGLGKLVGAVARGVSSGESMFITEVSSSVNGGVLAIAPACPGTIVQLDVGAVHYRLNDSTFLAMQNTVNYSMQRQSLGKAAFAGTGGFFVMTTEGQGALLVNAFGSVKAIDLVNEPEFTIDNGHVVAWDTRLNYEIKMEGGFLGSIGTGEGVVNTFSGTGRVYIQTLNLQTFASQLGPFIATAN